MIRASRAPAMSVIAPCRSNPSNTVASSNPESRIVHLHHQGIRDFTDRLRSEPPAEWGERAAGAGAACRALHRNTWPHGLQPYAGAQEAVKGLPGGVQNIGSFSLKELLSTIGMPVRAKKR